MANNKGVFCIEGLWDNDLKKKSSISPILELLNIYGGINYIYKDFATIDEFEFFLNKWTQKNYRKYPILYIASHGKCGKVCIGKDSLGLDEIANILGPVCKNRIIVLGCCETMAIDKRKLKDFLVKTKALAICGYSDEVPWLEATAFELLLIDAMQENEFSGKGIGAMNLRIKQIAQLFKGQITFRMVTIKDLN